MCEYCGKYLTAEGVRLDPQPKELLAIANFLTCVNCAKYPEKKSQRVEFEKAVAARIFQPPPERSEDEKRAIARDVLPPSDRE